MCVWGELVSEHRYHSLFAFFIHGRLRRMHGNGALAVLFQLPFNYSASYQVNVVYCFKLLFFFSLSLRSNNAIEMKPQLIGCIKQRHRWQQEMNEWKERIKSFQMFPFAFVTFRWLQIGWICSFCGAKNEAVTIFFTLFLFKNGVKMGKVFVPRKPLWLWTKSRQKIHIQTVQVLSHIIQNWNNVEKA